MMKAAPTQGPMVVPSELKAWARVSRLDDVASAREMLDAGADLIQLYTGLIYEGPFLPARLTRGL